MNEPLFPCTSALQTPNPPFWTTKTAVPKFPQNGGSTPTPCLDKAVHAQRAMRQRILGSHTPPCHMRKGGGYFVRCMGGYTGGGAPQGPPPPSAHRTAVPKHKMRRDKHRPGKGVEGGALRNQSLYRTMIPMTGNNVLEVHTLGVCCQKAAQIAFWPRVRHIIGPQTALSNRAHAAMS